RLRAVARPFEQWAAHGIGGNVESENSPVDVERLDVADDEMLIAIRDLDEVPIGTALPDSKITEPLDPGSGFEARAIGSTHTRIPRDRPYSRVALEKARRGLVEALRADVGVCEQQSLRRVERFEIAVEALAQRLQHGIRAPLEIPLPSITLQVVRVDVDADREQERREHRQRHREVAPG